MFKRLLLLTAAAALCLALCSCGNGNGVNVDNGGPASAALLDWVEIDLGQYFRD